jgi:hypothetical protein
MLVGYSVKLLMVLALYFYMWSVNKHRDTLLADSGLVGLSSEEEREAVERGMLDVTEIDNLGFRYFL